jgi:hypothetical protein
MSRRPIRGKSLPLRGQIRQSNSSRIAFMPTRMVRLTTGDPPPPVAFPTNIWSKSCRIGLSIIEYLPSDKRSGRFWT